MWCKSEIILPDPENALTVLKEKGGEREGERREREERGERREERRERRERLWAKNLERPIFTFLLCVFREAGWPRIKSTNSCKL